jgi:hypothetical protein
VRHNLVQQIIKAYDEFGAAPGRSSPAPNESGKNPNLANPDLNR